MIAACYIIHYGKEWLHYSLNSVQDFVDEIHIYYTHVPSHGHATQLNNPDTREELLSIAKPHDVFWHDCPRFAHEGEHREYAVEDLKKREANMVLVVDADEIWPATVLQNALREAAWYKKRSYRIGMRHFYRSLAWVCDDAAMPTRIIKPFRGEECGEGYLSGKVFHMGYAQTPALIQYKQDIHGHKSEWRPEWFTEKFLNWTPPMGDVHPTNKNYWFPSRYTDEDDVLKNLIGSHPYWHTYRDEGLIV